MSRWRSVHGLRRNAQPESPWGMDRLATPEGGSVPCRMGFEEVRYVYEIERLRKQPNYREGKWWMPPLNSVDAVAAP